MGIVGEYELVVAGLTAALAPYGDRVQVIDLDIAEPEPGRIDLLLRDAPDEEHTAEAVKLARSWDAKLVVFSWSQHPARVAWALTHGAAGYILKSLPAQEILSGLELVHAGSLVRPPPPAGQESTSGVRTPRLTRRETEVVLLIASGRSNEQIASLLFLSINSIKSHIRSAYRKMGVTRRSQAVTWAFVHGMVPEGTADERRL